MGLREKTGMISDTNAKAGMTSTYTSGWPKIQKKCIHRTAEPPAWVSKKCAPRKRSRESITWAAVSGEMTRRTMAAHDQVEPDQERHFAEAHAGAAETDDGSDKVDGGADAAESGDKQAESPEIGAVADRKCPSGEGSIGEPADVRRAAGTIKTVATDETEIEEQAAERGEPETPGIEAGKGHVARADHQRDEVIAEAEEYRHGDEENHGGAMHGEHAD